MTIEEFNQFIATAHWKTARTMPQSHHCYTRKYESDPEMFMEAAHFIWNNGTPRKWLNGRLYRYFQFKNHEYWLVDPPSHETIIINRRELDGQK